MIHPLIVGVDWTRGKPPPEPVLRRRWKRTGRTWVRGESTDGLPSATLKAWEDLQRSEDVRAGRNLARSLRGLPPVRPDAPHLTRAGDLWICVAA